MYKSAAALIGWFLLASAAAGSPGFADGAMPAHADGITGSSTPLPLLLAQETADGELPAIAGDSLPAEESDGSLPMAQQIVAGVLTGALAAILVLRIVFRWRRNKGAR